MIEALTAGRAAAEALMLDTCRVTSTGVPGGWDDDTGNPAPGATTTVYEGPCKLQVANLQPRDAEAGEVTVAVTVYSLHLPIDGTGSIGRGMTAEMLTGVFDPSLVGVRLTIQAPHQGSQKTARRFTCEVAS